MGARLNAFFSSDIGHFDVPDMTEVVPEAYELVEHGLLDDDDFRDFMFANAVRFWGRDESGLLQGHRGREAGGRRAGAAEVGIAAMSLMSRPGRRDFLRQVATLVAAGTVAGRPVLVRAGETQGRLGVKTSYSPTGKFELKVSEVEFYRTAAGRQLMARVYQPQGPGPFPTVLDLHGGAWRRKDRLAEEPMDRAIAASGALVVAIDLRLSEEAPYPGVGPGRELRRALAQIAGRRVER